MLQACNVLLDSKKVQVIIYWCMLHKLNSVVFIQMGLFYQVKFLLHFGILLLVYLSMDANNKDMLSSSQDTCCHELAMLR